MLTEKGQTLMELTVVLAVAVLVVGALTFATIASIRNASFAKNQAQATKLAQEAIERVRIGRDRNQCIRGLGTNINSWNGSTDCPAPNGSIWNYRISGDCDKPDVSTYCYFNVSSQGALQNIGSSQNFPSSAAEGIPPRPDTPIFERVITLSDDLDGNKIFDDIYSSAKKVTAIVRWTDFSGKHESRLTTILRNPNL